jgi:hypothetical protein
MADTPITREEKYLAYLTGDYKGDIPKPITRRERYLYELCLKGMGGEISPEEIKNAVNEYLEKNPVKPGATTEQAQQIEQNKTDIASLKTETASLKEDLSTKITKFYASNQGETHLADSDNGKIMDMMLYGKSEQKQYSGKNLLNATLQTTTQNMVTCTNNGDGTYALNGSNANTPSVFTLGTVYLIKDKKYKMAGCPANPGKAYLQLRTPDNVAYKNDYSSGVEFVIPKSGEYIVRIYYDVETYNNLLFKPMITTDTSATYDDFEPYTGGIPSPNPDYPQEIKSVVNPTVKVCGKNLLNYKETIINGPDVAGIEFVENGFRIYTKKDVVYCSSKTYLDFSKLRIGETYTLSANLLIVKGVSRLTIRNRANTIIADSSNITESGTYKIGFTLTDQMYYVSFFATFDAVASGDVIVTNIQLEKGSTPTTYEPYHEQTVTLPYTLNAIPVESGGNVTIDGQQYIADYVDVERGKLVRCVLKFDPSLLSVRRKDDEKTLFTYDKFDNNNMYKKVHGEIIAECSHLKVTQNTAIEADEEFKNGVHVSFYATEDGQGNSNVIYICVPPVCGTTALEFLEWSNKNAFEIIYKLATHTEIDLTKEEIAALKALVTYYPTTNISVNSEQLDGYTVFNYPISMENGWNYVKQQIGDTRDYIYDMDARTQDTDLQAAEAYVNSEYAVALTELEV